MSLHSFNLSKPFPPCPTAEGDRILPFKIDEMDFSDWLKKLATADNMTKCKQIFFVLQTLNTDYPPERKLIPGRTRLFFLEKLNSMLTASISMLSQFSISSEGTTELSLEYDKAKSEISVWSSLELANAYLLLSQEDWFIQMGYYSMREKSLILSNGINAMGRSLLYISQAYTKPCISFWHKCFQLYRIALLNRMTEKDFNPDAQNIENAFKRLLVFALSNTNQFSPQEMHTIFELLGHYAVHTSLLASVPKKKFKGIPSVHLKGNGPPTIANENPDIHDPDRLYIATVTVASKILEATYDKRAQHVPTDRLMLLRLAKTLTLNEQRKNPRESARGNQLGIMGFDNIFNFLQSKEVENKNIITGFGSFDPDRPGELRELNFEIVATEESESDDEVSSDDKLAKKVPSAAFQIVEFTDPSDIWKKGSQDVPESNMRLLDKSAKGNGLLWTDKEIKPKVGSIIGILQKNVAIGLIRWLAQSKETGMFMGVELLGTNATTVKVYNPGYPDNEVQAIYLQGNDEDNQSASLIFINKEFKPNEFIFLQKNFKNVRYRLVKQLHLTSFINHVEVVRSH